MNQQLTIPIGIYGGHIITEITCEQFVRLLAAKFPTLFSSVSKLIASNSSTKDLETAKVQSEALELVDINQSMKDELAELRIACGYLNQKIAEHLKSIISDYEKMKESGHEEEWLIRVKEIANLN